MLEIQCLQEIFSILIIPEMGAGSSRNLPHNYEAIIKDADMRIDDSSMEKLYEQLYAGIFLNKKRNVSLYCSVFTNTLK